tara:strand:- start:19 stop:570 length:552 start_codon:yes stop_codon:yes gene_type:complete
MIVHPITQKVAKELIFYNDKTGVAIWKKRTSEHIKKHSSLKSWNTRHAGNEIKTVDGKGYLKATIIGKQYILHRLIWLIHYGSYPNVIDHINGIRTDNRISNLENTTSQGNHMNQRISSKNTSGVCGVYKNKSSNRWCAQMKFNGKTYHLGSSKIFDEAVKLRKDEEKRLGFSERHGEKINAY